MAANRFSSPALRRLTSLASRPLPGSPSPAGAARCLRLCRPYSAEAQQAPPLLSKLKGDLKAAMRAKDAPRLSALRAVLAATTNAAKTSSPIRTDAQLVALLRKTAKSNQAAADEARGAGRQDIVDKEEAQIRILDEYAAAGGLQTLGAEALRGIIQGAIAEAAAEGVAKARQTGEVMKKLNAKGGPLDGKDVDKAEVAQLVKEMTA